VNVLLALIAIFSIAGCQSSTVMVCFVASCQFEDLSGSTGASASESEELEAEVGGL